MQFLLKLCDKNPIIKNLISKCTAAQLISILRKISYEKKKILLNINLIELRLFLGDRIQKVMCVC